ncbi:MAG: asparagine synthase (glutamine-hydrolyzing) [Phycisphaerales bacterium]|nr:asparagine synthase (glutamine-hydrolyzing) [Phycisphaerales bacterium]
MCGIAGFIDRSGLSRDAGLILRAMGGQLAHRGPDDSGFWWDEKARIGFAHRRLSIVDLTAAGHQPMASASGRFMLVTNGEIYNAPQLRAELANRGAHAWRGHSDTEVMLAAFDAWGVVDATKRFEGMFAFAVYDFAEQVLQLVRDRIGEKPLYYGWIEGNFVFASEIDSLRAGSTAHLEIDRDAAAAMLRFGHVPAPLSIYRGISKLLPGHIATWRVTPALVRSTPPTLEQYWSAAAVAEFGCANPLSDSIDSLVDQFEVRLERAVRARMICDVPLGAFLSGGIDSALVVSMMARMSKSPLETFTIGFEDEAYDESAGALEVARALGTKHHRLRATARDAVAIVPTLSQIYDEPFADSSQIPTAMLSVLARSRVTVALSGDGGDEVFGGYDRHVFAPQIWKATHRLPRFARKLLALLLRERSGLERVSRMASILEASNFAEVCRALAATSYRCDGLVIGAGHPPHCAGNALFSAGLTDLTAQMMQGDLVSYLVDDVLVKVDRASMAVGLEVRCPMLDHQLIEWAWRVPMRAKVGKLQGKLISRRLAARLCPQTTSTRPKQGFGVPLAQWMCNELRPWIEDLLAPDRIARDGLLDPKRVRALWEAFLAEDNSDRHLIWAIVMFQSWLDQTRAPRT